MSVKKEKYTRYDLEVSTLVTKEFPHEPRQTEIISRLENPTVDQYVDEPARSSMGLLSRENPVYMITGLKFAKGKVVFRDTKTKITELRFRYGIADPVCWTERDQSGSSAHRYEGDEETIVAYKLLKIEKKRQGHGASGYEVVLSEVTLEGSELF
ncbi:hypothetical protein ACHAPE_001535 [Trichoderma viride]